MRRSLGVEHLARLARARSFAQSARVVHRVAHVPPAGATDVPSARPAPPPTSPLRSSRAGCGGTRPRCCAPSSTPRTTRARRPRAARRRAGISPEVVVVRRRELPAAHASGEPRAVLDDQGVRRHVVGFRGDRRVEAGRPVLHRLPRRAVDEVEVHVLEAGRRRLAAAARARPGVWVRSRVASTCGEADCMPTRRV